MTSVHVAAFALLGAGLCLPTTHTAEVGDPAAPLKIAEWVKGDAVDLAKVKGKKIVVVEFWATWCPPCRTSIPHLTELQKKFKDQDVVIVGVSGEKVSEIKPFVAKQGDKMNYVVAADDGNATAERYMTAYQQNGIPHAFIVDKESRVVWHGHPMIGLEGVLNQVVAGQFDLEASKRRSAAEGKLQEYTQLLASGADDAKVKALEQELVALDREVGGISPGQKFDPAQVRKQMGFSRVLREYQKVFAANRDDPHLPELEKQLVAGAPPGFDVAEFRQQLGAQVAFTAYMQEAMGGGNPDKLTALGRQLETAAGKNAQILNQIAWTLLTDENLKQRDLVLATKLARSAYDASEGKTAAIADTYARALFDSGKVTEAIQMQKKAIAVCQDDELRKTLETALKTYEAKAARP